MRVTEVQFSRRYTKQQKASLQNNWPHDNTCRHFQYRCCRRQVSYKLNLMNVNETFITAPSHKQIKMQADILWATGLKRVLYGYISIYSTYISVYSTVIQLCCEYISKYVHHVSSLFCWLYSILNKSLLLSASVSIMSKKATVSWLFNLQFPMFCIWSKL